MTQEETMAIAIRMKEEAKKAEQKETEADAGKARPVELIKLQNGEALKEALSQYYGIPED